MPRKGEPPALTHCPCCLDGQQYRELYLHARDARDGLQRFLDYLLQRPFNVHLFNIGQFHLSGGGSSPWRIDCDALSEQDWQALAALAAMRLPPFGAVMSVGGAADRFAAALAAHVSDSGPLLLCDDVLTTGRQIEAKRAEVAVDPILGVVVFARGPLPPWVQALFVIPEPHGG